MCPWGRCAGALPVQVESASAGALMLPQEVPGDCTASRLSQAGAAGEVSRLRVAQVRPAHLMDKTTLESWGLTVPLGLKSPVRAGQA